MTRHRATRSRRRALLLAAPVAVLALAVAAACGWVGAAGSPADGTTGRAAASADPFDVAAPAPAEAELSAGTGLSARTGLSAGTGPSGGSRLEPRAVAVLHRWDARRAAAYASGSPARLRALYAGDAGRADVRLLRDYRRRGFTVRGLRMQLLAVTVLAHRTGVWRLRVTDRLARATAVRDGTAVALPRDAASTRLLALRRAADGRWRVVRVSGPGPR